MSQLKLAQSFVLGVLALASSLFGCAPASQTTNPSITTYSYGGAGSHYSIATTDTTFTISKYATYHASGLDTGTTGVSDFALSGTIAALGNGFQNFTVNTSSGSGGPSGGEKFYGIEIQGLAMFLKPLQSTFDQMIPAVSTGTCPASDMTANWILVKKASVDNLAGDTKAVFGTMTYKPSSGVVSMSSAYTFGNVNLGATSYASTTCKGGVLDAALSSGDTATIYLGTTGGILINTSSVNSSSASFALGFPISTADGSILPGSYGGIIFSETVTSGVRVRPASFTVTWTGAQLKLQGSVMSDVNTGALSGATATIMINSFNSPLTGIMTGTLSVSGGVSTTTVVCSAVSNANSSGRTMITCTGRDPLNTSKLFTSVLVSI